jgi:hypothetical protein
VAHQSIDEFVGWINSNARSVMPTLTETGELPKHIECQLLANRQLLFDSKGDVRTDLKSTTTIESRAILQEFIKSFGIYTQLALVSA